MWLGYTRTQNCWVQGSKDELGEKKQPSFGRTRNRGGRGKEEMVWGNVGDQSERDGLRRIGHFPIPRHPSYHGWHQDGVVAQQKGQNGLCVTYEVVVELTFWL